MRSRVSAGLVLYQIKSGQLEVFLAHPGGPFFAYKDDGHWTIPKGEIEQGEDYLATAIRECQEEVGIEVDSNSAFLALGFIQQKGGKIVHAWGVAWNQDGARKFTSNTFSMEWPPGSGTWQNFPEVDRAQFFPLEEARTKIKTTQIPLLNRLEAKLRLVK